MSTPRLRIVPEWILFSLFNVPLCIDSHETSISILEPICPDNTITTHRGPNSHFLHAKWASGNDILSEAHILLVRASAKVEIRLGGIGVTRDLSQDQIVARKGSLAIVGAD